MLIQNYPEESIPLVLTVDQLAEILKIGRNSAYQLVRSNRIASIRVGNQIRIPRQALLHFLGEDVA